VPAAFSRSTPTKPLCTLSRPASCQNGTLRPPQSPFNSANGFALFTSTSSKVPWLGTGALNRKVAPAVQFPASFAIAPTGSNPSEGPRHTAANHIRHVRIGFTLRTLIAALASPPHATRLFQIALAPPSISRWPFPSLETNRGYSSFHAALSRRAALLQR